MNDEKEKENSRLFWLENGEQMWCDINMLETKYNKIHDSGKLEHFIHNKQTRKL